MHPVVKYLAAGLAGFLLTLPFTIGAQQGIEGVPTVVTFDKVFIEEDTAADADVAGNGQLWVRDDAPNMLFFTDDEGNDFLIGGESVFKSYTFAARAGSSGEFFQAGFYDYAVADANLSDGGPTVTHGGTNAPYGAHAFIVSGGNGTTDGSDLVLTVTGTSITDAGVRNAGGTEVIEATAEVSAVNTYFETSLKWIGTITYTLTSAGGGTFSYDFNYGFAKYDDFGDEDFIITDFESVGEPNTDDGGFNIQLLHHNSTGWTYHVDAFVAGNTPIADMNADYSTEQDIDGGEPFAYKRTNLAVSVAGSGAEGVLVRVTTSANGAITFQDTHIGVDLQ
jgi:hypothetical protein